MLFYNVCSTPFLRDSIPMWSKCKFVTAMQGNLLKPDVTLGIAKIVVKYLGNFASYPR